MENPNDLPDQYPLKPKPAVESLPAAESPLPRGTYPGSPRWSSTTKLVVALSLVAIFSFLVIRFLNILGPILLAFIFAYLFYPLADAARKEIKLPWRSAVTILYIVILVLVIGSIAIGGLTVIEQVQNLINFITLAIEDLPQFITDLTSRSVSFGPFVFDFKTIDADAIGEQVLTSVQPILTRATSSVVSVASGAASLIGWIFFILLLSYFILAESGGFRLISLDIPGYSADVQRLGVQLSRIWDAFLRGQLTIVLITIVLYTILLGALGMKFYFGLALLAGLARFIPYVGPFVAWTSYGLVAFFQGSTVFGLAPLGYVGVVVGIAWLLDMIMDNVVTPRLMSNALRVHPAAVMVSALVAFNLLGVIGVVLAAPVLATCKLFLEYFFAKLFDRDPWEGMVLTSPSGNLPSFIPKMRARFESLRKRIASTRRVP